MRPYICLATLCVLSAVLTLARGQFKNWADEEETSEYWNAKAQEELKNALNKENLNTQLAKNVIMFLGDGMGVPTITTARILKGQLNNQTGEEYRLAMEKFSHAGLSKTYSIDRQTTDSAATATAYLCGVKSKYGTIGLSGEVERAKCQSSKGLEVDSILADAYREGKSTGIISTVHLVHASPAGTFAHVAERGWYSDARLTDEAKNNGCDDIAKQFYKASDMVTVALSGGRSFFRPTSVVDEEYNDTTGEREDGQDYIQQWIDNSSPGEKREYVWDRSAFNRVDAATTDKLLGLFEPQGMAYEIDRDQQNEPSIAEMVEKAIQILRKNENGYFLFVEGGNIDLGHHDNSAIRALHDTVAFDDAIEKAAWMTSESDTLIVITADHSHTMSFGGYTWRGNPILGVAPYNGVLYFPASDGKRYTSILYNNGPGYQGKSPGEDRTARENLRDVDTGAPEYKQQSAVPHQWESHGGEDVAIFARGPMAHLFHGVHEQNYIPHAMRYASCIGENKDHCAEVVFPPMKDEIAQNEYFATFINIDLTVGDTLAALYVQFVIVLSLVSFSIFLILICHRDPKKGGGKRDQTSNHYENEMFASL